MFGWRRRSDGFEWRKYVRTTIALRRQARRERAEALAGLAAEGVKAAGAAAGTAARQGARQFGAGSRVALSGAATGLGTFLGWSSRAARAALGATARGLGHTLAAARHGFARIAPSGTWRRPAIAAGCGVGTLVAGWLVLAPGQTAGGNAAGLAGLPSLPSLSFLSFGPATTALDGRAAVAGPGSLRIGQTTFRLLDIEALDREQVCSGPRNRRWRCGDTASATLSRLVAGRNLACRVRAPDAAGVVWGSCADGGTDVAAALVKSGHAFASPGSRPRFAREEAEAKAAKVGLWSGEAERPEAWRQRMWAEAQKRTPSGCPIKGRVVAGGAKTYVLPWAAEYERVRVDQRRGGRWFCSEREAQDAGWKPDTRS